MQELQNIADRLKSSKESLLRAQRLVNVAKKAGEDVASLELDLRNKQKKFSRWEVALKEEGIEI